MAAPADKAKAAVAATLAAKKPTPKPAPKPTYDKAPPGVNQKDWNNSKKVSPSDQKLFDKFKNYKGD